LSLHVSVMFHRAYCPATAAPKASQIGRGAHNMAKYGIDTIWRRSHNML
jgi:hypothetical protein